MRDFGGLVRRTPEEVVRPATDREAAAAARRGAVPRGRGHSTGGQSLTGGVSLDTGGLAGVHAIGADRVSVGAGATWRDVLAATLPHGLMPPVLTDLLDLTVGGTLSAGGVGGTSHVHGTQACNTLDLDVATRDGEIVRCSPAVNRPLFDAVRAGMGRHGVITRATLRLVPAPRHVLSCKAACRSAAELLRLQAGVRADHLSGQARPAEAGWRYEFRAVLYEGEAPPPGLPAGAEVEVERLPFAEFADRMRPDVEELIVLGEWDRPHPWAMAFLPGARAAAFVERTLAAMGPADLGLSGLVLIKALKVTGTPGLRAPAAPVLLGLLRTASLGYAPPEDMVTANERFTAEAAAAGGVPYPAVPYPGAP
ncbi:FAD-binding protein [Spirillospora sp. NPDC029432]|uniref:FAD-binding protein n=1 Tax=Spirillospora sp. NPDC029432 TaxID=3154599 RepID=UPI00345516F4